MSTLTAKFLKRLVELSKVYLKFSLAGVAFALAYGAFTGPLSLDSTLFPYSWITIACIAVIIIAVREIHLEKAKH